MATETAHRRFMEHALKQARLSPPGPDKFCVGACLVDGDLGKVLSTGYSMELPGYMNGDSGSTHAEQCCFVKIAHVNNLPIVHAENHIFGVLPENTVLYTTMEPCNERLSHNTTCVERILQLKDRLKTVIVGIREPSTFIADNQGIRRLERAGIRVQVLEDMRDQIMTVTMAGHEKMPDGFIDASAASFSSDHEQGTDIE